MRTSFFVALILILSPQWAFAGGRGGGAGGPDYESICFFVTDANRNHVIDREESKSSWSNGLFEVFDVVDADHDGVVNHIEFSQYLSMPLCVLKRDCPKTKPAESAASGTTGTQIY